MRYQELARELSKLVSGRVIPQAFMRDFTTWRIGGPADLLCEPATEEDVQVALGFARKHGLPVTVVGNGSNLLVLDGGIRGLTLRICGGLKEMAVDGEQITAGAGAMLPALSRLAARSSLSGLEFGAGIPAAVGGAVLMNAGAFGQIIGNLVQGVQVLGLNGRMETIERSRLEFHYRHSSLMDRELVILKAVFRLCRGEPSEIWERMSGNLDKRKKNQPLDQPSAGSVFRNPPGGSAGELIERAGFKGVTVGDAQVSPKHANFIVNLGNARAGQVLELIERIRERVSSLYGVELVPEVRLVGEEG